jgi:hypothetical protein
LPGTGYLNTELDLVRNYDIMWQDWNKWVTFQISAACNILIMYRRGKQAVKGELSPNY